MASFEVRNDYSQRTVFISMSGLWADADLEAFFAAYRKRVDYRGRRHMVLADMRGMKPMPPAMADRFGVMIAATRKDGVVLCAHISDHTVQRLQLQRVARENSAYDDITVDVASMDEAHRVLAEARLKLDDPRYSGSIREPVALSP